MGLHTVDCNYVRPGLACGYILEHNSEAAIVETGTSSSVPLFLEKLDQAGIQKQQVKYIIITHVHLDHAGGASTLLQHLPEATLLCHPKAERHVVNPSRLIESSIQVYGEELFNKLYGEIPPAPQQRVRAMADGESILLGHSNLHFFFTKGHANHHFCVHDEKTNGIFTGDTFGIGYSLLQANGPFLFPSTTPTDFDPAEARASIQRILDTNCNQVYLTHFGAFQELKKGKDQLLKGLDTFEALLEEATEKSEMTESQLEMRVLQYLEKHADDCGLRLTAEMKEFLAVDSKLNAAGIHFVAARKRKKSA